jgi:hypothetical protein
LIDDVLAAAWERLDVDEVAAAFAATAAALLARDNGLGARCTAPMTSSSSSVTIVLAGGS